MTEYMGFPVHVDPRLPGGVIGIRSGNNPTVLFRIECEDRLTPALIAAKEAVERTRRSMLRFNRYLRFYRYPTCYLPMRTDLQRDVLACGLCGREVSHFALENRSRWRRRLDWLTGMEF